jgi:outer membrane protein insertion porin family
VRVLSAGADTDRQGKGFFLTFSIDEGPRYTFGAVELEVNLKPLNANQFRDRITGQSGDTTMPSLSTNRWRP